MLDLGQIITIGANVGVIAGIVFLAWEVRQNNRFMAAQARYSLRQYRNEVADSMLLPNVLEAAHKWARGEELTDIERSTGLMAALKLIELWEWQHGEYAAGSLTREDLPVGAWRLWFHGAGPMLLPVSEVYAGRKAVLNPAFVDFFEQNVVSARVDAPADLT